MRQALREAIIPLTLAAGVLVAAGTLLCVFAGSAVPVFVLMAGAVVMATLGAVFMVRLNVVQASTNARTPSASASAAISAAAFRLSAAYAAPLRCSACAAARSRAIRTSRRWRNCASCCPTSTDAVLFSIQKPLPCRRQVRAARRAHHSRLPAHRHTALLRRREGGAVSVPCSVWRATAVRPRVPAQVQGLQCPARRRRGRAQPRRAFEQTRPAVQQLRASEPPHVSQRRAVPAVRRAVRRPLPPLAVQQEVLGAVCAVCAALRVVVPAPWTLPHALRRALQHSAVRRALRARARLRAPMSVCLRRAVPSDGLLPGLCVGQRQEHDRRLYHVQNIQRHRPRLRSRRRASVRSSDVMSSMDGHMGVRRFYDIFPTTGAIEALKALPEPISDENLKSCPMCRGPLRNINRYNRIVRQGLMEQASRKFVSWAN